MIFLADFADTVAEIVDGEDLVVIVAIVLGCTTGIVAILARAIGGTARTRAREAARRDIAAYVAEGTLDPDKAIALMNAGVQERDGCCGLSDLKKS